jgi:hypothetical protein
MDASRFKTLLRVKRNLAKLEQHYPTDRRVKALHESMAQAVTTFCNELSPDQFTALGGGTDKPPAPVE